MNNPAFRTLETQHGDQSVAVSAPDIVGRTAFLLSVLGVVAAGTWLLAPHVWWAGAIVGLVLGLVNIFKRNPSPALITAYAAAQGVFLGGISYLVAGRSVAGGSLSSIVAQAITATIITAAVALWLYSSGRVTVTRRFRSVLLIGMISYLAFALISFGWSWLLADGSGGPLRDGWLGIVVALVVVVLAAMSFIADFDAANTAIAQGAPKSYAWTVAFGLTVTLVWLYSEMLRAFEILGSFND